MALWKSPMKSSLRTQLFLEFPKHVKVLCFKLLHYTLCFSSWNRMINRYFMTEVSQFTCTFSQYCLQVYKDYRFTMCSKDNILSRVSIRKTFAQFLRYSAFALFCFAQFCDTNSRQKIKRGKLYKLVTMRLHRTDYLPKTLFCNLMHDDTLQIKMLHDLTQKVEQYFTNYLF